MGLYLGGLIITRIFVFEIWDAYFWEGLFLGQGGGGGGDLNLWHFHWHNNNHVSSVSTINICVRPLW